MSDWMDWWTCLIWWTYWHAWFDINIVISLKHSPERYINASFLYVYLYSDDNDDYDGYDNDSDDDGDDDSDSAYDGLSDDHDS